VREPTCLQRDAASVVFNLPYYHVIDAVDLPPGWAAGDRRGRHYRRRLPRMWGDLEAGSCFGVRTCSSPVSSRWSLCSPSWCVPNADVRGGRSPDHG
jgi:hypothetical protein